MKVKLKSKNGDTFYRLGKALDPDNWIEFDLVAEAEKRGTTAEQLLGQLMKSAIPVRPRRTDPVKDDKGNEIEAGKVIPRSGGGAVELEPLDDEARVARERILKRRAEWEVMTPFQKVAAGQVLAESARAQDEQLQRDAVEKARAWATQGRPNMAAPAAATAARSKG